MLTSVTGFPIPPPGLDPPRIVGILSLVLLAIAIAALYVVQACRALAVALRRDRDVALYLNCFVGVVQTFQKVAFFNALAPTQTEPPFAIAQGVLLVAFIVLGALAVRRFRPAR